MKTTQQHAGELHAGESRANNNLQHVELQHINVKLLLKNPRDHALDLDPVIPVFHSWIQEQVCDELLLDVTDYRHLHGGPGIVLIGHEADYSLDHTDNRLGVRYNRKAGGGGGNQERLAQATHAALSACQRLQKDTRLNGKVYFNGLEIEIFVNDRLLAPNSEATREVLNAEFQAFSKKLFGGSDYALSFGNDSRRLLAVSMKTSRSFTVEELLENLRSSVAPVADDLSKHGPSRAADHDWRENEGEASRGECVG
jgi:hypothetical protein